MINRSRGKRTRTNLAAVLAAAVFAAALLVIPGARCAFAAESAQKVYLVGKPVGVRLEADGVVIFGLVGMGVVGTAMAFTLYLQGVNDIGPVKTSLLSCSEIVTAAILTCLWLKTPLVWQDFLGMAFIVGMVAFLSNPGRNGDDPKES